jgi:hypothetical protein
MANDSFAAALLAPGEASASEARRFAAGLALTAIYGLALGARFGVPAMAAHAAGVPLALVAVAVLGAPAFYIGLAHTGIDVDGRALVAAVARGVATSGVVLAGLAPALALMAVCCESAAGVAWYGAAGLAVGGLLGLRALYRELPASHSGGARVVRGFFAVFAALLAARVWWLVLPLFGGAA